MGIENPLSAQTGLFEELVLLARLKVDVKFRPLRAEIGTYRDRVSMKSPGASVPWARDFHYQRDALAAWLRPVGSRRVVYFGVTRQSRGAWVAQQLREATPNGQTPRFLIRDNVSKIGAAFASMPKASEIHVLRIPFRAPRANAISERFLAACGASVSIIC